MAWNFDQLDDLQKGKEIANESSFKWLFVRQHVHLLISSTIVTYDNHLPCPDMFLDNNKANGLFRAEKDPDCRVTLS